MPKSTTLGIVPAMFQVPISAPIASSMKIGAMAVVTPPIAASATAAIWKPFFNAIKAAKAALNSRATCNGPFMASAPNRMMVVASSVTKTTTGSTASSIVGGRASRRGARSAMDHAHARGGTRLVSAVVLAAGGAGDEKHPHQGYRHDLPPSLGSANIHGRCSPCPQFAIAGAAAGGGTSFQNPMRSDESDN